VGGVLRMQVDRSVWALILSMLLFLSPSALWTAEVSARYRLGVGDKLQVTVFGHEALSGQYTVAGNGEVELP
jgi:polysaccharide export outer membrane protein